MPDSRYKFEDLGDLLGLYLMANCLHFKNYTESSLMPYQQEIWNFISYQGHKVVPFICRDKQKKLAGRDIAVLAMDKMLVSAKANDIHSLKRHMTEGVNNFLKFSLGKELFDLIENGYKTPIALIKNSPSELSDEEKVILGTAGNIIKNSGINAGLIRP